MLIIILNIMHEQLADQTLFQAHHNFPNFTHALNIIVIL